MMTEVSGVAAGQLGEQGQLAGGHDVDGHAGAGAGREDGVKAGVVSFVVLVGQHDATAHDAGGGGPLGHVVVDGVGGGVEGAD